MTLDQSALFECSNALRADGDLDPLRSGRQLVVQSLIEMEAARRVGAAPYSPSSCSTSRCSRSLGAGENVRGPRIVWMTQDGDVSVAASPPAARSSLEALARPPALRA
jgi:hypothetical protein